MTISDRIWHRVFIVAAATGIIGWFGLMLLLSFWYIMPAQLPTVTQPLPILNANHQIAIGEELLVMLKIQKDIPKDAIDSDRYITCDSGNLVTLTSNPTTVPVGTYTIVSNDIILPNKVLVGDTCIMNYSILYYINPLRNEILNLKSDEFTIVEKNKN